jgi:hypothetical protein
VDSAGHQGEFASRTDRSVGLVVSVKLVAFLPLADIRYGVRTDATATRIQAPTPIRLHEIVVRTVLNQERDAVCNLRRVGSKALGKMLLVFVLHQTVLS